MISWIFKEMANLSGSQSIFRIMKSNTNFIRDQKELSQKGAEAIICFFGALKVKISKRFIKYKLKSKLFSTVYQQNVEF